MDRLFAPRSIAIVGASSNPLAIGGQPIRQLRNHGFTGQIYPVNPNRDVVQELKCYPSIADLPEVVDVAIIAVPAAGVAGVVEQCGKKGIPYAVVLSSGFADASDEGARLQDDLLAAARRSDVRLLGPNTVGYISMGSSLYAGFGAFFDYDFGGGDVGFVTQSGGVGGSLLTILDECDVKFRHFVHTGNAADMDIETVLDAFVDDPGSRILLAYIEGLAEGSRFAAVAERALREGKPLIAWKAGKSAEADRAVVSHTGRMAGNIERYRSVFARYGVIEVDDTTDLADVLKLAQLGCFPAGRRVGIVSVSGGAGVIAADCLSVAKNIELAKFRPDTEARIAELLPGFATSRNPIDVTAQIFNQPDLFEKVVKVLCDHDEVDAIVACVASVHSEVGLRVAGAIQQARQSVGLPIVAVWASRGELNGAAFRVLDAGGIPLFRSPERALKALDLVSVHSGAKRMREARSETVAAPPARSPDGFDGWSRSIEFDVLEVLKRRGVPVPEQRLVSSEDAARAALNEIGGPVVMKIQSPDIAHKAKLGGVRIGVRDGAEAATAFREVMAAGGSVEGAEIRGVALQSMARPGVEVICGYLRDQVLGDFLVCGGGGVDTESERDIQLLPMPAREADMERALLATRAGKAVAQVPGGVGSVVAIMEALQGVAIDNRDVLSELEINPVIVSEEGACAVDALAIARPTKITPTLEEVSVQ